MTRIFLLMATAAFAFTSPAFAQHAGHGATPPPPAPPAVTDPTCPPEHAAMGHCTPAHAPAPQPSAPVSEPGDSPVANAPASASAPHAEHASQSTPSTNQQRGDNTGASPSSSTLPDPSCPREHAAMGHCTPAAASSQSLGDPHAGHAMRDAASAAAPPVAPPPAEAFSGPEHAADTVWDPQLMARIRAEDLLAEHGGYVGYMVLLDRLEYRARDGRDGYAWDGEGWYGGDYNRLWIKSEGEGEFGGRVESAEIQALYSRAIDPWFNLQAGVRYDMRPKPDRAHLVLGIQGLAPYWFEVDGALFLSDRGDLTARFEAEYDQRITNRLILQPRVEVDLAAQDVTEIGVGAGLSSIEAGLRLRYEVRREFAPYFGVEYERRLGNSADFARAAGEDPGGWAVVFGLRSWF